MVHPSAPSGRKEDKGADEDALRIPIVVLRDADRNDVNPLLVRSKLDINAGNAQIAHGISFVLRPADL
ncbi:hypothetical protein [Cellulomonas sp. PSBB021]|uniref:hypothetical protein n=1 Tax=Cellulomonas sp. PSBB021 TaxID=2003551 RepID=UPI001E51CE19|nr:hypothetical protein [Cellulomonas sp. PSBB021]